METLYCHRQTNSLRTQDIHKTAGGRKRKKKKKMGQIIPHRHMKTAVIKDKLPSYQDCKSDHVVGSAYAEAGFTYLEGSEAIRCDTCGLTLTKFTDQSYDPVCLHQIFRPDCAYLERHQNDESRRDMAQDAKDESDGSTSLMTITNSNAFGVATPQVDTTSAESIQNVKSTYKQLKRDRRSKLVENISMSDSGRFAHYSANMLYEVSRKGSFDNKTLPHHLNPGTLARKGFHHGSSSGEVVQIKCAFCKITIPVTESVNSDSAVDRCHYSLKPDCPLLRGYKTSNVPDIYNDSLWSGSESGKDNSKASLSALGINNNFAKHSLLAVLDSRMSTFLTYPHEYKSNINVNQLAHAGYFYQGEGDSVTCFYCDCKSGNWSISEDVWKRHARTSPHCQHVLSTRGAHFVSQSLEELGEYRAPKAENVIQNVTTRMIRPRWDSPVVRRAIELGVDKSHLKTAIINRIKARKRDFRYLADIMQAVNDLQAPSSIIQDNLEHTDKLPEVVQLTHSPQSDDEDDSESSEEENQTGGSTMQEPNQNSTQVESMDHQSPSNPEPVLQPEPPVEVNVRDMMTQLTCKICFSAVVGIIFLPCGHLVCCVSCAPAMVDCPICRKTVSGTVQAFMP